MPTENKSNKIITIVLAAVITIAALVIIYVNLSQEKENNTLPEIPIDGMIYMPNATLTIIYGDQQVNYSFYQIANMTSYTGIGGKISKNKNTTGPYNYTGVKISTILNQIENLPEAYNITVTSSDGYTQEYSYDEVQGKVILYNETRVETGMANLTMIIAYTQEGMYLDSTDGPLMIAFVDDYYTASSAWAKMLASIEIVEQ